MLNKMLKGVFEYFMFFFMLILAMDKFPERIELFGDIALATVLFLMLDLITKTMKNFSEVIIISRNYIGIKNKDEVGKNGNSK